MTVRKTAQILLVDDDPGLLKLLSMRLQAAGYQVEPAASATVALARLAQLRPDIIITDLRMEGMDGMDLLREANARMPGLPVILITAHGTIPDAVAAVQQGAFGFLTKPVDRAELLSLVERALRVSAAVEADSSMVAVATRNTRMNDLLAQARMIAVGEASVLVLGESGSGKEVLARAIHDWSGRREGLFVAINCSAIPAELMEAELFDLLQSARGGTVFLDEIGDMPVQLQAKLLRVIEGRQVRPVAGLQDIPLDIRVLSATHRDLSDAIKEGTFREDLFYRLNVVTLETPPLRERREDIPLLVQHMLATFGSTDPAQRKVYSPEAMEMLVAANWPGNIRQLRNVIEQTVALSASPVIGAPLVSRALGADAGQGIAPFAEARDEFTRQYLVQLLHLTEGKVSKAARLAQRNRTEFYKLLTRYEIDLERFKNAGSQDDDN